MGVVRFGFADASGVGRWSFYKLKIKAAAAKD